MSKDELILYATPTGAFADACERYWAVLDALGSPTTAQTYPPHCTLTGFFHRALTDVPRVVGEVAAMSKRIGDLVVSRAQLDVIADWVGFVLESRFFEAAIEEFVSSHVLGEGDDPIRAKSWLHLSLSYGQGADPERHRAEAERIFEGVVPTSWSLDLWRRRSDGWYRLRTE